MDTKKPTPRFSEVAGLNLPQHCLDFVDIPVNTDIRLFVDPFALSIGTSEWAKEGSNDVRAFFQLLLQTVRKQDSAGALRLLKNIGEDNRAHLGYSKKKSQGKGIGNLNSKAIYMSLSESLAAKTGLLTDLEESALFVRDVGNDKISDLSIALLRDKLLKYTDLQCRNYSIPTAEISGGMVFCHQSGLWKSVYAHLPMFDGKPFLLVPKSIVRYELAIVPRLYYNYYVVNYLQQESLSSGSSLVTFLKNGQQRVYKKDIKNQNPLTKELLARFSEEHPEVLSQYKKDAARLDAVLSSASISAMVGVDQNIDATLKSKLKLLLELNTGGGDARKYHELCFEILQILFDTQLNMFRMEDPQGGGLKRVDITAENVATYGLMHDLALKHRIPCPYVFFECKNYEDDVTNPEFDQLSGRLSDIVGKVGFLLCRSIKDRAQATKRCARYYASEQKLVILITDELFKVLLEADNPALRFDEFLRESVRNLKMTI